MTAVAAAPSISQICTSVSSIFAAFAGIDTAIAINASIVIFLIIGFLPTLFISLYPIFVHLRSVNINANKLTLTPRTPTLRLNGLWHFCVGLYTKVNTKINFLFKLFVKRIFYQGGLLVSNQRVKPINGILKIVEDGIAYIATGMPSLCAVA
jgi:hypothetical protein